MHIDRTALLLCIQETLAASLADHPGLEHSSVEFHPVENDAIRIAVDGYVLSLSFAPEPQTAAEALARLGHGFLLPDAMTVVSWPSSKLSLARHLADNGFTSRRDGAGAMRWYAPASGAAQ